MMTLSMQYLKFKSIHKDTAKHMIADTITLCATSPQPALDLTYSYSGQYLAHSQGTNLRIL